MAALASLGLCACVAEGNVSIDFIWPDTQLAPVSSQIAEITLVRSAPGEPTVRTSRRVAREPGQAIDMGAIEAGEELRLAVELRSSTLRLIGYGRSEVTFDLEPGGDVEVPIHVRRPFVYVTGDGAAGDEVATFDPTRDQAGVDYRGAIRAVANPIASVVTQDGQSLVLGAPDLDTVDGFALYLVSTADHQQIQAGPIPLAQRPVDLAASWSGRYVVAAHEGPGGGISVVDLEAVAARQGGVTFVATGSVSRVAMAPGAPGAVDSGAERVFALVDRSLDCQGAAVGSRIEVVDIGPDMAPETGFSFPGPVQDLAALADTTSVIVANACDGVVERVSVDSALGGDATRTELGQLLNVSVVSVLDGRIWSVGSSPPQGAVGARLLLASMGLEGQDLTFVDMPSLAEQAKTPVYSDDDEVALRQIAAEKMEPLDLAVLPGATEVAILTKGFFNASEQVTNGTSVLPAIEIDNFEYLLVDTTTSTLVQRVRTWCDLRVTTPGALVPDWVCTQAPGQDESDPEYQPSSLSVLYGAR